MNWLSAIQSPNLNYDKDYLNQMNRLRAMQTPI